MTIFDVVRFAATWKRLIHNKHRHYDSSIDYESYLEKGREEFKKKWSGITPSPKTGLSGFKEIGTLGSGSFGTVLLVQDESTGEYHAAKVLSKHKIIVHRQVINAFYEKRVLHSISFPNHTSLAFSRKDNNFLYLVMTLVRGGELFAYHRKVQKFPEKQAIFYAAQVFLALEYLHSLNLIYRDLKPENICIDMNGYIKVTDYGFTKYVPTRTLTLCGTPEYLAPEVLKMKPYSTSVDWWTFGIFVYEMVSGASPFGAFVEDHLKMYDKICDGHYKMPDKFSSPLKHLVSHLLQTNASKRLGVCNEGCRDIKRHMWFAKVDWFGILNQVVQPPYMPTRMEIAELIKPNKSSKAPVSDTDLYEEVFKEF